jgi:hypothetical protein
MYHKRTLEEYIQHLESLHCASSEYSYPTVRIGHGNPYYKCKACGVSDPEISISGHEKGCEWLHKYRTIQGLKKGLRPL